MVSDYVYMYSTHFLEPPPPTIKDAKNRRKTQAADLPSLQPSRVSLTAFDPSWISIGSGSFLLRSIQRSGEWNRAYATSGRHQHHIRIIGIASSTLIELLVDTVPYLVIIVARYCALTSLRTVGDRYTIMSRARPPEFAPRERTHVVCA